jgi:hypothetical protein
MMQDSFRIDTASGSNRTYTCEQRRKLVECAEMRGLVLQNRNEGLSRVVVSVERSEQRGPLDCEGNEVST